MFRWLRTRRALSPSKRLLRQFLAIDSSLAPKEKASIFENLNAGEELLAFDTIVDIIEEGELKLTEQSRSILEAVEQIFIDSTNRRASLLPIAEKHSLT